MNNPQPPHTNLNQPTLGQLKTEGDCRPAPCSMPIYQSAPDGKWHCSVRSPEGYGFDLAFESEEDFLSLLDSLKECANEPEGLAEHIQHTTEVLASNSESSQEHREQES